MTPDQFVKYADGALLLLMWGFLLVIAIGLALEAMWVWFKATLLVSIYFILLRWRAWRGRDPDDHEHA